MALDSQPAERVRELAAKLEELGFGAIWHGEAFGRDTVSQSWLLLSSTERLVVGAGVANIAMREPVAMAARNPCNREQLAAGANHVCLQVLTGDPAAVPLEQWRELADLNVAIIGPNLDAHLSSSDTRQHQIDATQGGDHR